MPTSLMLGSSESMRGQNAPLDVSQALSILDKIPCTNTTEVPLRDFRTQVGSIHSAPCRVLARIVHANLLFSNSKFVSGPRELRAATSKAEFSFRIEEGQHEGKEFSHAFKYLSSDEAVQAEGQSIYADLRNAETLQELSSCKIRLIFTTVAFWPSSAKWVASSTQLSSVWPAGQPTQMAHLCVRLPAALCT